MDGPEKDSDRQEMRPGGRVVSLDELDDAPAIAAAEDFECN